ncbi:Uncharacterised protein [Vibrio cholerae]|nr:Uncharacterised protein [Vibrio cholerae]
MNRVTVRQCSLRLSVSWQPASLFHTGRAGFLPQRALALPERK